MAKEGKHSCIDCAVTLCDAHNPHKAFPAFCISRKMTEEQRNDTLYKLAMAPCGAQPAGCLAPLCCGARNINICLTLNNQQ